ncbi:MAG: xylulokinase [Shimia sp.]
MYLGLDLGTSGLKALVIDEGQGIVAEAVAPLTVQRPHPGWSEQDPAAWIAAAEAVLAQLGPEVLGAVRAVGLSGQQHGATMLDASDTPIGPCILWNDTRAAAQAAAMDADPRFRATTGNITFPGFTAPKLAWLRETDPAAFDRVAKVLLPKDYLRLWLTGEHVSEMSDSAGTGWLDVGARAWDAGLIAATHLTPDHMPRLIEGAETGGTTRAALARVGLPEGTPVAGGGGDNAASAVGMGVVRDGEGFVSLGTSGVLFVANETFRPDPATAVHTFCHALPGTWHQMGVILAATDALNWLAGVTGVAPEALTDLGPVTAPGATLLLPYLGGERTPINSATARGAFLGLGHASDRTALARAVLEGVAFAFRDCRDALAATGTETQALWAIGGGSRSRYWVSLMASMLGQPMKLPSAGDFGGAFGAARLGMLATGALDAPAPPPVAETIDPDPALADAMAEGHARYAAARAFVQDFA